MRPLPENTNKIYELTIYDGNLKEAYKLFNTIQDPLDKIYSRLYLTELEFVLGDNKRLNEHLHEIENNLEVYTDPFAKFMINLEYFLIQGYINIGFIIPIENYSEGKKNYEKSIKIIENHEHLLVQSDSWTYHNFLLLKYLIKTMIPTKIEDKIYFLEKSINETKLIPEDGEQLAWYFNAILGFVYTNLGRFVEAREKLNVRPKKFNSLISSLIFEEKARLSYIEGNLSDAIQLAQHGLDTILGFNWGISLLKNALAFYYAESGEYEKAKQFLIDLIPIKKVISNPFSAILGYYNLIRFLTNYYQISDDGTYISEAKLYLNEAKELALTNMDNINVKNYLNISEAIILKFGRFSDKSKAYAILKGMAEYYSRNLISVQLRLDLIELLIEEAKANSSNQETLSEIVGELDNMISIIAKKSILFTPKGAILKYIQQQILVSRYYFYIKGEFQEALNTLEKSLKEVERYDLPELRKKLEGEIEKMNNQVKIWSNQTLQERFNKIELNDYFKQALQIQKNLI